MKRPRPAEFVLGFDGQLVIHARLEPVQLVDVFVEHGRLVVGVLFVRLYVQLFPVRGLQSSTTRYYTSPIVHFRPSFV